MFLFFILFFFSFSLFFLVRLQVFDGISRRAERCQGSEWMCKQKLVFRSCFLLFFFLRSFVSLRKPSFSKQVLCELDSVAVCAEKLGIQWIFFFFSFFQVLYDAEKGQLFAACLLC